ncbi:hypothetical protein J2T57_003196 [Natronocella acetinitrilica]|uniref:DUF4105 domain-containing protein n=1 Tax=Natronocella acetinitrilica TaxID=414046 RepID=A0AAE3G601_9GAMM|nr:DUF4105 domain-containing protein [Natronocella acetinitrilica]MCP1676037.1 hypothetical protein [Natronocella acetinitrilica]
MTWRLLTPVGLLLLVLAAISGTAGATPLETLQIQAREARLSQTREWQDLLHYRERRFLPGRRSATRTTAFFNAEAGWRDPQAELDATLAAFFLPLDAVEEGAQHPQCRFPARFRWLEDRLDWDGNALPQPVCEQYEAWRDAINPHRVTLIFAAAYLNNPASMFGHTLLRLDQEQEPGSSRLLSYVINHAAATDESSGFVFAVRGLTGGYPGLFSIMPYYEKVREYNALENRDLWEYELDLTPEEVERLLMHTWELQGVAFPYFFLYQNCSYRLLGLLDVARPGMALSDRFNWYAIPTDTVRVVLEEEGLFAEVVYRPAERTVLEQRLARLDAEAQDRTLGLAQSRLEAGDAPLDTLDEVALAELVETAYGYLHFQHSRGQTDADERERMRELLLVRSQLARRTEPVDVETPAVRPDEGHGTLRMGLGGGRRGDGNFVGLHWRPAYHDFLDPPAGYIPGAHIAYGDLELRYDMERDRPLLERLMFVDIESIAPRDQFFRNWSWRIRGGFEQRLRPAARRSLMGGVAGGGGYAWQPWSAPVSAMAGVEVDAWASERLPDKARAGAGPRLDLFLGGERLRWRATAIGQAYTDTSSSAWRLDLAQSTTLGEQASLRLGVSREQDFDSTETSLRMTLYGYF